MSITTAELIAYGSASRPEDDVSLTGGAIDLTDRPDFTQFSANALPAIISDGADTRNVTIQGRTVAGVVTSETKALTGAVEVVFATTFERILTITIASPDASRTVLVKQGSGGTTRATIGPNETSRTAFFRQSMSEAGITDRYEKLFWKNTNGTLTLTAAQVTLTADPDSRIMMGLATSKDDSGTVANRKAAPAGVSFVDDGVAQNVPGNTLEAGSRIGTWINEHLPASDPVHRTTFTTQLAGTTT